MKIFINEQELNKDFSSYEIPQILEIVKSDLKNEIIKKIILNEVEINQRYLKESLVEKKGINKLKFITQKTDQLILETLDEIDSYLPRLKKGCLDAAELYRNGQIEKGNQKYQLILDGLSWYTNSIFNIVNLLDNNDFKEQVNYNLLSLNEFLDELKTAQENEDNILIADILEYEIIEFIKKFISLNKKIMNLVKEESDKQ